MDLNRNQFFILGAILLFFGVQFRLVESYVLNEKASKILNERMARSGDGDAQAIMAAAGPTPHRTIKPPEWLGWCLISTGGVILLHSLVMRKPGG